MTDTKNSDISDSLEQLTSESLKRVVDEVTSMVVAAEPILRHLEEIDAIETLEQTKAEYKTIEKLIASTDTLYTQWSENADNFQNSEIAWSRSQLKRLKVLSKNIIAVSDKQIKTLKGHTELSEEEKMVEMSKQILNGDYKRFLND